MVRSHESIEVLAISQQNSSAYSKLSVLLFTTRIQIVWAVIALLAFAPELLPSAHVVMRFLLLDYLWKALLFMALGFVTPLAFRSINGIVWGFCLSLSAAPATIVLQSVLSHEQAFHWYELVGKLAVVLLGFAFALEFRYAAWCVQAQLSNDTY